MTAIGDINAYNADHDRRWFGTGHDGAWPDRRAELPQRPWRLAAPCIVDRKIAPRIVIARSDQSVRPVRSLPSEDGATLKSP